MPEAHEHSYGKFEDCFGYKYLKCSCGSILMGGWNA
jgi:hypothetical protein